ncbi:hypothetical protein SLEP1_g37228 [Rubroshorea leprosula]|uniref:Uncharacterized protein n=1 Tax=Rubroshorea leprosula TaxID=152421 RepID=A0AAV5KU93_9ROSI|nr:hypothetical protein SLEP1_g37228 [Rubroshorea leprosula]
MSSKETISDDRVRGRVQEIEGRDLRVPLNILEREDEREECSTLRKRLLAGGEEREGVLGSGGPLDAFVLPLLGGWVMIPHPKPIGMVVAGVRRDEQDFLEAAGGVNIPKKGRGKRAEDKRRVEEEGPIVAKRKRMEQQEAVEEIPELVTSSLRIEGTSSATAVEFVATLQEQRYIRVQTTSFYDFGIRSTAKRFINAYFPEVDRQRAKDEVAARGSVGVVRQALEAMNLVNALANEHHESLKERNQMRKDNAELVKKNEEAEAEQKKRICEDELEKMEKELEEAVKAVAELELKVHNSVEEHVKGFLKSSTFEDIVNLYQLPTTTVPFSDCQKKVKLQYPDVDVMKITFGDQEGEVEENGESSTADFCSEVTLKWDRDSRSQTILPPKFNFEFVAVGDKGTEGADNPIEGVDNPDQPTA